MTQGPWTPNDGPPTGDPVRRVEAERRPKRRLFTFWRVVAVIALALFGWGLWQSASDDLAYGPHVAHHEIVGVITVDDSRDALLRDIAADADARALVLRIDSPGGTATGAEALFDALRSVAEAKPVVAVMGEVAASGGYIAALGADHVVARGNTLTGSIGVIVQTPDVSRLLSDLGVEVRERRSDIYKAQPSPFAPTPPEVAAWQAELIADSYAWFRALVGERRGLAGDALAQVANGRVFTGRQAERLGLIDAIGGPPEARDWLTAQGVDPGLPLRDRAVEEETPLLLSLLGVALPAEVSDLLRTLSGPRLMTLMR